MEATRKFALVSVAWMIVIALAGGLFGFVQHAQAADLAAGSLGPQATSSNSKVVSGTIKSGGKVTKTFTMPKKGYVTFTVRVPKGLGTTSIKIDSRDIRYVETSVNNGNMPGGPDKYVSKRFSFKPKAKIKVTLELPRGIISQKLPYKITMKKSAPKRYESELNNKKSTADKLTTSGAYSGNIIKKDTDWFFFKAPSDGTYRFSGKVALVDGSSSLDIVPMALYQGKKTIATGYPIGGNGYATLSSVPLKKGDKIYVKVMPVTAVASNLQAGLSSLPANLGNLPTSLTNLPSSLGNLPVNLGNLPVNLGNLPTNLTNLPVNTGGSTTPAGGSANVPSSTTTPGTSSNAASGSSSSGSSSTGAVNLVVDESVSYALRVVKLK